jgi:cobalt-zinc-cadmium efflux system membrane fusion protein
VVLARNASVGGSPAKARRCSRSPTCRTLWVDLHIFGADASTSARRAGDGHPAERWRHRQTTLERVLPGTATASQSTVARATLRNRRPVAARLRGQGAHHRGPAAGAVVPLTALQTFRDRDVVFVRRATPTRSAR